MGDDGIPINLKKINLKKNNSNKFEETYIENIDEILNKKIITCDPGKSDNIY